MDFNDLSTKLDKIQGDKKQSKANRLESIDEISNEVAKQPDSVLRTKILKRCSLLASQIEFDKQTNLV